MSASGGQTRQQHNNRSRLISVRPCLTSTVMSDKKALLAANAAFYAALATGDVAALGLLWADDDGISCIHPGWPAIVGRAAVIGSWREILKNPDQPQIACHDPHPLMSGDGGDGGHVICVEIVGGAPLAASNHFRLMGGTWRLVHHQSSPIAGTVRAVPRDPPMSSNKIH
jgi:SnoaL-like protein